MTESGIPVILVTHQLERMTSLCSKAILLDGGRVARHGTPEECVEKIKADIQAGTITIESKAQPK